MQKFLFLVLSFCFFAATGWGQGYKMIKPAFFFKGPNKFELGNFHIVVPSSIAKKYGADLEQIYIDSQLDPSVFTRSFAKDHAAVFQGMQRFLQNYRVFHANEKEILSNLKGQVVGKISYAEYLPPHLQNLYIGESHDVPGMEEEVIELISQLPQIYPNRSIYLATEFLVAKEYASGISERIIRIPEQLHGEYKINSKVLYAALKAGIPLLGLEPEASTLQKVVTEAKQFPIDSHSYTYSISLLGMRFRNQKWVQSIRQLREMDPDALIVVYAGSAHVCYHFDFNLPSALGGKSFMTLFTPPKDLVEHNPLYRYVKIDRNLQEEFSASSDSKLVTTWQKPTKYKKIMGADMVVVFHPKK